jgi:hypothetical protein
MPVISNPAGWEQELVDRDSQDATLADGLED